MKQSLQVEIFRDVQISDTTSEVAEHGIDLIRQHSVGLEIVRKTRLIRLADDTSDSIDMDAFRWPRLDADVNIILTNRTLTKKNSFDDTLGYAQRDKGIAVINLDRKHAHTTIAHETSHLFGLKHTGNTYDGESHCIDESCMMHAYGATVEDSDRVKKRGLKGWLERRGYTQAEYETTEKPRTESFCQECTEQLGYNAFWLLRLQNGEWAPNDIVDLARSRSIA